MTVPPTPLHHRLVLASHNPGKLFELRTLLRPWGLELASAGGLGLAEVAETADSFEGNALLKATAAARESGLPALADDTGLVVPLLGGRPGVQTARYAEQHKGWRGARKALAEELGLPADAPIPAQLHCALCVAWPKGANVVASAYVDGRMIWPPDASLPGFAAMFDPNDDLISHRGVLVHRRMAFARLNAQLRAKGLLTPSEP